MSFTQALREFWTVPTLDEAEHARVTVPPQPEGWTDAHQSHIVDRLFARVPLGPGQPHPRLRLRRRPHHAAARPPRLPRDRRRCRRADARPLPGVLRQASAASSPVLSDGYGVHGTADTYVDGACSFYVFQHMPCLDMARSVLEGHIYRVLRPGAWCVLQTVDTRFAEQPLTQVGFRGARQTPAWLIQAARDLGFVRLELRIDAEPGFDLLMLAAYK